MTSQWKPTTTAIIANHRTPQQTLMYTHTPCTYTHTHTHLTALFPGLPGSAGTRKVKPIWISLKQETVSGSGIRWAICKSAPRSRHITIPAPHHSVFYRPDALPAAQPTVSKHWRHSCSTHISALICNLSPTVGSKDGVETDGRTHTTDAVPFPRSTTPLHMPFQQHPHHASYSPVPPSPTAAATHGPSNTSKAAATAAGSGGQWSDDEVAIGTHASSTRTLTSLHMTSNHSLPCN